MIHGKDPLPSWEFHREEFCALRTELDRNDKQRARLQYATVGGSILITWSIIRIEPQAHALFLLAALSLAPLVILASGWLISRMHVARAQQIGAYLRELEKLFGYRNQGWETYVARLRNGESVADFHHADPQGDGRRASADPRPPSAATTLPINTLFVGIGLIEAAVLFSNLANLRRAAGI